MSEAVVAPDATTEEEFDEERVAALVSELTIGDLEPVIAEAGPRKLDALEAAEKEGKERVGVFDSIEKRRQELAAVDDEDDEDEEEEIPEAPIDEIKPIIRVGDWVTLGRGKGIPNHVVNLDAVVERANVKHSEGGDTMSPSGYEFQDDSDTFLVRVRNTGDVLEVTRAQIANHGTQQSELGFRP